MKPRPFLFHRAPTLLGGGGGERKTESPNTSKVGSGHNTCEEHDMGCIKEDLIGRGPFFLGAQGGLLMVVTF